jgi:hypothetical protein
MTEENQPTPFMHGTFAIFETPDGGYVIAWREDGNEQSNQIPIPGMMVKQAHLMSKIPGAGGALGKLFDRKALSHGVE